MGTKLWVLLLLECLQCPYQPPLYGWLHISALWIELLVVSSQPFCVAKKKMEWYCHFLMILKWGAEFKMVVLWTSFVYSQPTFHFLVKVLLMESAFSFCISNMGLSFVIQELKWFDLCLKLLFYLMRKIIDAANVISNHFNSILNVITCKLLNNWKDW